MEITKDHQVIQLFSLLANCNQNLFKKSCQELDDNAEKQLNEALLDPIITKFTGKWNLVWGPCLRNDVFDKEILKGKWVTANLLYVVEKDGKYIVATAGTNASPTTAWFEDIDVVLTP